jgi:hypothetical protein
MLYTFGDSYSCDSKYYDTVNKERIHKFLPLEKNWTSILSEKLTGNIEHINDSIVGCSNEFIFHRLMTRISEFKEGDYVVVSATSVNRRWLIERRPDVALHHATANINQEPGITKEERAAILQYTTYLHSDLAAETIYDAIFWATVYAAQRVEDLGVRFLIIPGFRDIPGVNGNLFDLSNSEFDNLETRDEFYKMAPDLRWNHLTEVNHKILADKVFDFFTEKQTVDLTTGFQKNIYTKNNI